MAPKIRQSNNPLNIGEKLFAEPHGFNFFKAVRLIERFAPEKIPLGKALTPRDEAVRFTAKPSLSFQASDIAELLPASHKSTTKMDTPFFSILGSTGILPHWFTELAIAREKKKDRAQTAFYNMFHHRQVSLFFLAWQKYRLAENYSPGGTDAISGYLLSLIGLGTKNLTGKMGVPEESLIFCSGQLSRRIPSAMTIKDTVQYFSGCDVEVEQFIERMLPLPSEDKMILGKQNCGLGTNTVCGNRVWECQSKFKIIISPTSMEQYHRFLPSGDLLGPITASTKYLVGIEFEFDITVKIPQGEIDELKLGDKKQNNQLGWTSWLKSPGTPITANQSVTFGNS